MNKSQLIDALAERFEGNRKQAAQALDAVLDTITREVARGEKVAISGFGSFERRIRGARNVRNPRTGEQMTSQEKAVPKFTPGADLRNVVAGVKKLPELTLAAATAPARAAVKVARKGASGGSSETGSAQPVTTPTAKKSTAAKPTPAKKTAAKSTPAKKTAAKSSPAKSTTAKKTTAKKSTAKSTPAKKAPASKTAAKKTPAKKAPAKKTTAKKAPSENAPATKATPPSEG